MRKTSDNTTPAKQAISILLVFALLSLTMFPIHYHFHHEAATIYADTELKPHGHDHGHGHGHVPEIHKSFSLIDSDHPEDSHTMEPVSDIKLKSVTNPVVFAFLVLSLLVIPLLSSRIYSRRLVLNNLKLPCLHWYKSPPLRAPPIH